MAEGKGRRLSIRLPGGGWDWLFVGASGLLVQALWLWRVQGPTYMDAFYYTTNGQRLAGGYGFTELVLWQFLDNLPSLPVPSHTYWQPMPSIIAAVGRSLIPSFTGAQLLFWLMAGLLPLLAYAISKFLGGPRWQAWAAALFTASGGYYSVYFNQPSSFAPFAWFGGGCLLLLGLANSEVWLVDEAAVERLRNRRRFLWALAGLLAGHAHLTRADGMLFLLLGILVWLHTRRYLKFEPLRVTPRHLLWFVTGYGAVMGVWFLRNWAVFGRPVSAAGLQSLFLTSYDDLFAYGRIHDLQTYLAWGWDNILGSKLEALRLGLLSYLGVTGLVFLTPLVLIGWWSYQRQSSERAFLRPATWYMLGLLLILTLLFTFPSMRGSLFHSSVALWPWAMALAAAGLGRTVDWIAARLPHWEPDKAKPRFAGLFFLVALVIAVAVSDTAPLAGERPEVFRQIGDLLPDGAVVMVGNAPAFYYYTGLPAVSVPNEPLNTVLQAAERYGVTYLVLNENRPAPLADLYQDERAFPQVALLSTIDSVKLYRFELGQP